MAQTPAHGLRYPAPGDPADGPTAFQNLAQDVEAALASLNIGGLSEGALADRPAAGSPGRLYRVTLPTTDAGLVYLDTGSTWVLFGQVVRALRAYAGTATDVPLTAQGASGQSGDLAQFKTSTGTVLAAVKANGRPVFPVDPVTTINRDSANGNRVSSVVVTQGGSTLKTTTFTYNGDGSTASIAEAGDGRTVTSTFIYSSGLLSSISKVVS